MFLFSEYWSVFSVAVLTCVQVVSFYWNVELHLDLQRRPGGEGSYEGRLTGWCWLLGSVAPKCHWFWWAEAVTRCWGWSVDWLKWTVRWSWGPAVQWGSRRLWLSGGAGEWWGSCPRSGRAEWADLGKGLKEIKGTDETKANFRIRTTAMASNNRGLHSLINENELQSLTVCQTYWRTGVAWAHWMNQSSGCSGGRILLARRKGLGKIG